MKVNPISLLLALVLILVAGLAGLWVDRQGDWRNITWTAPTPKVPDLKSPAALQWDASNATPVSFASIQDRPIFSPDRRQPPPPPPPAPPPPPDPLAEIQLYGVFTGSDTGIIARVEGKLRRVKVNDTLGQWTLKSVEGRSIVFVRGKERRELKLAYARLSAPVPPPPPVASALPRSATAAPTAHASPTLEEEMRARLIRRNAVRAANGLPPATE